MKDEEKGKADKDRKGEKGVKRREQQRETSSETDERQTSPTAEPEDVHQNGTELASLECTTPRYWPKEATIRPPMARSAMLSIIYLCYSARQHRIDNEQGSSNLCQLMEIR